MALTHILEHDEVTTDTRRIFVDVRASLDLPFVPTLFKLAAGEPEYLKTLWDDLRPVARSREFQGATKALQEFAASLVVSGAFRFEDQQRVLAAQKFSATDADFLRTLATLFERVTCQMALFSRLLQRGYSGGQRGRVSDGHQAAALSRLMSLHVPKENDAGLRAWLIYGDIRRTTGARNVMSVFRVLAPFPGYLASVWAETKKLMADPAFLHARDELTRRSQGLMIGLPVRDHRAAAKNIKPERWRDIEETVDSFARLLPQFVLILTAWQRSFAQFPSRSMVA